MLSLARSRYTLLAQLAFLATNAIGVVIGIVYNRDTPDLYPHNAHHKLGWIVTWVVMAQVAIGVLGRIGGVLKSEPGRPAEQQSFIPVSSEAMAAHHRLSEFRLPKFFHRHSNDSGHGTELHTESLRSQSVSDGADSPTEPPKEYASDDDDDEIELEPPPSRPSGLLSRLAGAVSSRAWSVLIFAYNFVDRTILILGFIALCTGIIAFGHFFVSLSSSPQSSVTARLYHP
jgi:hypothetical protein